MRADKNDVGIALKTARGQIENLLKMLDEDAYCIDISNQILSTRAMLDRANRLIVEAHIKGCITESALEGSEADRMEKIEELSSLLKKLMK